MLNGRPSTRLGAAPPPTAQYVTIPASVGGVNSIDSLMAMPPEDCIYTYNAMPVEYGLRLRKGYREWGTGADGDIRTVLAYEANTALPADDRLWGVTSTGIWNFTAFGETEPTQDVVFTENEEPAGFGNWVEFTNDASEHYLFYADGLNGIHQYEETTKLWTVPTGWTYDPPGQPGNPVDFPVDDVVFVMIHKLRIWVILENSSDAWYLPIASIAGELKKFTFGAKMLHGGRLLGLYNWTLDGGDGIDDYLIALSKAGDLIVYRGGDPENTDPSAGEPWMQVGSWFVGECTNSRRGVVAYGAEMYVLSSYGITSLRDLLQGSVANENRTSPSAKVNLFLRADIHAGSRRYEWSLNIHPADGFMQVVTPVPTNTPFLAYNQNLSTKAWGFWEGVPQVSSSTWNGEYMMGGQDGIMYLYDGELDGTKLDGTGAVAIGYRLLTSFQAPFGAHSSFKRVGFIRTMGVLAGTTTVTVRAVYDYAIETTLPAPPGLPSQGENVWDSAVWDNALWSFSVEGQSFPAGTLGIGRAVAVALNGSAASRINIVGWDLAGTMGGFL